MRICIYLVAAAASIGLSTLIPDEFIRLLVIQPTIAALIVVAVREKLGQGSLPLALSVMALYAIPAIIIAGEIASALVHDETTPVGLFTVALIEEAVKVFPAAILIAIGTPWTRKNAMLVAIGSALGFAAAENAAYLEGSDWFGFVFRTVVCTARHAAYTCVACYAVMYAATVSSSRFAVWVGLAVGLLGASALHTGYNLSAQTLQLRSGDPDAWAAILLTALAVTYLFFSRRQHQTTLSDVAA